jgi:glycosyltransferase involved in cell wall biosynthesis
MRVLHIIDSLSMGGAETWLVEMVRYAASHQTNLPAFDFLVAGGKPAIFDDFVREKGCRVHYLSLNQQNIMPFVRGFRKILRTHDYIAIHDHQDYLAGWHFLFGTGLLPKVRAVHVHNPYYQLHNNYGVTAGRRMKLKVGRTLLRTYATHIFGTSARLLEEYAITRKLFPRQWVGPVHCAFEISRFSGDHATAKQSLCTELGWPSSTRIVLFAGRLDASTEIGHPNNHKNSAYALEVIAACPDPDVRMVMAGAKDFIRDAFQALIDQKGLTDRVRLLGIRKDMPHLMMAADLLLFPSRAEGMGMVAVEAQAAGLPVLASNAVPDEVVVLEELVRFVSLDAPFALWAGMLAKMMQQRRPRGTGDDPRWKHTGFNMEICCRELADYYRNRIPEKLTARA